MPFPLLEGREGANAQWLSAENLLDLYLAEPEATRPGMIDLTGGQPELVPEWVVWTMEAMRERGVEGKVYLWSDDNLSNDYFWRFLSESQRELIAGFQGYGRVACFKGFDAESFAFNTRAEPSLFDRQFELFRRLLAVGIDLYAYVTFTTPTDSDIAANMARFVDRLQSIHPMLPLRTVPLKIMRFGVVRDRLAGPFRKLALAADAAEINQQLAVDAWVRELSSRFTTHEREMSVVDINMRASNLLAGGK